VQTHLLTFIGARGILGKDAHAVNARKPQARAPEIDRYELAQIASTFSRDRIQLFLADEESSSRNSRDGHPDSALEGKRKRNLGMNEKTWSKKVVQINGPDDLRETVRGSDLENVQLKPGKLQGSIAHFGIGNLGISIGRYDSGIRATGALPPDKVVLGTILDCAGRVTHWWKDVRPSDVCVFPRGMEIDAIHYGGVAYLTAAIALPELLSMFGGEDRLADSAFWDTKRVCPTHPLIRVDMLQQLTGIMSDVENKSTAPSDQAADFLQRAIVESFVVSLASTLPAERDRSLYTGARLVREAEDYLDAAGGRPVHISELCSALKVSRRSLHRAFSNMLGVGPVAYLRRRRLSTVRSVLSRSDPTTISIGDVAFENGFPEPGRFAAYYRAHFGETPSETFRSWSARRQVRP
jgi:AraC family ethanolamine operon transcriptional activator